MQLLPAREREKVRVRECETGVKQVYFSHLSAGCTHNMVVLTMVFKFSTYNLYAGTHSIVNNNIK